MLNVNTRPKRSQLAGFTVFETLIVVAVLVIMAAILLPMSPRKNPARGAHCISLLKQLDLAMIMYSSDYTNQFPMEISTNCGGTHELVANGLVAPQILPLQIYLKGSTFYNVLVCPGDTTRAAAVPGAPLTDTNISYFLNPDAQATNNPANTAMFGDRDLVISGHAVAPGLFTFTTGMRLDWGRKFHPLGENIAFLDGHVEIIKPGLLAGVLARSLSATNRLLIP